MAEMITEMSSKCNDLIELQRALDFGRMINKKEIEILEVKLSSATKGYINYKL